MSFLTAKNGSRVSAPATVELLSYEWCKPNAEVLHSILNAECKGVFIDTNAGALVLAKVERYTTPDESIIRRRMVFNKDVNTIDF